MNTRCPHCQRVGVFEWRAQDGAGWCVVCSFFEYYTSYEEFLAATGEGDAGA